MAVLQQASQQMRDAARIARDAEATRQTQALGDAASQMRQAASERMAGAIVAGAMQIAGGFVQLGAGLAAGLQAMGGAAAQAKGAAFSEQASTSRKVAAGLHDAPSCRQRCRPAQPSSKRKRPRLVRTRLVRRQSRSAYRALPRPAPQRPAVSAA